MIIIKSNYEGNGCRFVSFEADDVKLVKDIADGRVHMEFRSSFTSKTLDIRGDITATDILNEMEVDYKVNLNCVEDANMSTIEVTHFTLA